MMRPLLRLLASAGSYYAVAALSRQTVFTSVKVRQIVRGGLLLLGGAVLGAAVVIMLLVTLFFQLADMHHLVMPALITSGVTLLVTLLLGFEGIRSFRRRLP